MQVTQSYLDGIAEGRALMRQGVTPADALPNLAALCRQFAADSPVGQLYRGERDFWRLQLKKARDT